MRTLLLNGKPMTVTELYTDMKIEQSVASQHLGTLRRAGFVTCEREGKLIFYSINLSALKDMEQISDHISDTFKTQSLPTHRLHSL
jgi:DNA-binding transcriptional ArsR family regulator